MASTLAWAGRTSIDPVLLADRRLHRSIVRRFDRGIEMRQGIFIVLAASLVAGMLLPGSDAESQVAPGVGPDLAGIYAGRRCVVPNTGVCPEMNLEGAERLLTARGKAFANAFDELAAPKYDCWPATLPILFGDPYAWQIEQLEDRVILTYEKDDVVRTVWLDGHGHVPPGIGDFFIHGYSSGRYEGNRLVIETTHFMFDPGGLAGDFLSAPSSTQKRLIERYWREGEALRMDLTVEDPIFLLEPIQYVMEWRPGTEPLSLPWNCDPVAAQRSLKMVPSKYPEDPPVERRNQQ